MARRRLKLYGKKATSDDILEEINRLLYAKGNRPYPLKPTEIANAIGMSRQSVYNYIKKLSKNGKMIRLQSGHFFLPKVNEQEFCQFNKLHKFTSDPLVSEWMDDLLTRRQGLPLKVWKTRLRSVETVCNTCKVTPYDLTISKKKTEKIMRTFAKHFQTGDIICSNSGRGNSLGMNTTVYAKVQAVRDFCSFYDITWRKGVTGIMSQKTPQHGKYADIRLTDKELDKADKFIKEKWGLDSDVYRWFWVGIESCARFSALYNMKNEFTKFETKSKIIFLMSVFESKTEDIRGGKWTKFITRPDTQKSLELIKSRNCDKIYESTLSKYPFKKEMYQKLLEIYRYLGKNDAYYQHHPSHVLRHIGAHYWLSKTNYNYGIIAEVGGWHTIDELKKSYGRIPLKKY